MDKISTSQFWGRLCGGERNAKIESYSSLNINLDTEYSTTNNLHLRRQTETINHPTWSFQNIFPAFFFLLIRCWRAVDAFLEALTCIFQALTVRFNQVTRYRVLPIAFCYNGISYSSCNILANNIILHQSFCVIKENAIQTALGYFFCGNELCFQSRLWGMVRGLPSQHCYSYKCFNTEIF